MSDAEPEHKRKTRELDRALCRALDAADVALRRTLVLMTALGYTEDELLPALQSMACLDQISRIHEKRQHIKEIVEGVLP